MRGNNKLRRKGGYNPGDTWELFVGADNRIQEFSYHRGRDATHITVMSCHPRSRRCEIPGEGKKARKPEKTISAALACGSKHLVLQEKEIWLGGLDSNQDTQSQSLVSYQLDDLPAVVNSGLTL